MFSGTKFSAIRIQHAPIELYCHEAPLFAVIKQYSSLVSYVD